MTQRQGRLNSKNNHMQAKVLALVLFAVGLASNSQASVSQQIREKVDQYVTDLMESRLPGFNPDKLTISYDPAVDLLTYPRCEAVPEVEPEKDLPLGRKNLRVNCPLENGWTVYIPIRVVYLMDVAVIHKDIASDGILTDAHLTLSERDIGRLHQGYFRDTSSLVGSAVRRHLQSGTVLTSHLLRAPQVIERGDTVVIEVNTGKLAVRMSGTAMTSGRVGKQIPVRNNKSRRIIRAEVIDEGLVRVPM